MQTTFKHIVIPCLIVSLLIGAVSIQKTLSIFTDRREYTIMMFPYDRRGELYMAFDDGSTVKGFSAGDIPKVKISFGNTSIAKVKQISMKITDPAGAVTSSTLTDIASGETKSILVSLPPVTAIMLTPSTVFDNGSGENIVTKYKAITLTTDTTVTFEDPYDSQEYTAIVHPQICTAYIYGDPGGGGVQP